MLDEVKSAKWQRQRIRYRSTPFHDAYANLYLPVGEASTGRAMLCLHPTSPFGKDIIAGGDRDPGGDYALELADRGYVVLAPDYRTFGDYEVDFERPEPPYHGSLCEWHDAGGVAGRYRGVNPLESLPRVDPDRIGSSAIFRWPQRSVYCLLDWRLRTIVTSCVIYCLRRLLPGKSTGFGRVIDICPALRRILGSIRLGCRLIFRRSPEWCAARSMDQCSASRRRLRSSGGAALRVGGCVDLSPLRTRRIAPGPLSRRGPFVSS